MLIVRAFLFNLCTFIPMYLLGILSTSWLKTHQDNMGFVMISGTGLMMIIYELLSIPMIIYKASLSTLVYWWILTIGLLSLIILLIKKRQILTPIKKMLGVLADQKGLVLCFILLFLIQIYAYVTYQGDLASDISGEIALTTYANNSMFQIDSATGLEIIGAIKFDNVFYTLPVFYGMLAKISGIHPAIIVYNLIPIVILFLNYAVAILIGQKLFLKDTKKTLIFLCFKSLLNIFGQFSNYAPTEYLLKYPWQEIAIVINVIIPFIVYLCWCMFDKSMKLNSMFFLISAMFVLGLLDNTKLIWGIMIIIIWIVIYLVGRFIEYERNYCKH